MKQYVNHCLSIVAAAQMTKRKGKGKRFPHEMNRCSGVSIEKQKDGGSNHGRNNESSGNVGDRQDGI